MNKIHEITDIEGSILEIEKVKPGIYEIVSKLQEPYERGYKAVEGAKGNQDF